MWVKKKILILYASYGDGHRQVASALEQCLSEQGMEVVSVDLYAEAHPLLNAVTRFIYLKSFSYGSRLYGLSYYLTRDMDQGKVKVRSLFSFGIHKLKKILKIEKPDAVITTFPFSAMPELRRLAEVTVPIFTVITDFSLHDLWIHPMIDKYFVATEDLKKMIVSKGLSPDRVRVSGIPLRKTFDSGRFDQTAIIRSKLDPAKKTVLIMAGAYGVLHHIKRMTWKLLDCDGIQIVLVCGKNARLNQELEQEFSEHMNVYVFGYVEHIAQLMAVSTCIVTKAGGITLSEALSMVLPIVIFRPVPGQEKENAAYLSEKGASVVAHDIDELVNEVRSLVTDDVYAEKMKTAIQLLQKTASTECIVTDILEDLSEWHLLEPKRNFV